MLIKSSDSHDKTLSAMYEFLDTMRDEFGERITTNIERALVRMLINEALNAGLEASKQAPGTMVRT